MKHKIALIGGGVSNVTLSLLLNNKFDITIFERDDALLKKLRRTGNGRANIFNRNMAASFYNDEKFMQKHVSHIVPTLDEFFKAQNILTYTDEARRVYPYSESAKVLRDNLLAKLNAKVKLNQKIEIVKKVNNAYLVNDELFNYVVLAPGSSAGLLLEKLDNGNAKLFNSLNLRVNKTVPVIKTLAIKEDVSALQNIRLKARLTLYENAKKIHTEQGELMFKKDGLSGIVSFIVSSYFEWAKKKSPESTFKVAINLMPEYTKEAVTRLLETSDIHSFFDERLVRFLCAFGKENLVNNITNLTFSLVSSNRPENTQAMSGGVKLELINDAAFNLNEDPNIFVLGEALDIDGISGGYNLAFAFYTAIIAAKHLNDVICQ